MLAAAFLGVMAIRDPLGQSVAFWGFWVFGLYGSMVTLRRLGLFCYRQAVLLAWFPDRNRPSR